MAGIHKKLRYWKEAGLISDGQVTAITAYEKNRTRGGFGRSMTGLALFAIIVGVLSIVAANWAAIPGSVKIIVHLLINAGLAVTVWRADRDGRVIVREGALLALGGLTLTLIALIGQVFQLGGNLSGALLVWQIAILPAFVVLGRTRITALPGLLSLVVSLPFILFDYLEWLPDFWAVYYVLMFSALLPLALIGDGQVDLFRRLRPVWAATSEKLGFILLTLSATGSTMLWYFERHGESVKMAAGASLSPGQGMLILSTVLAMALAGLGLHWILAEKKAPDREQYRLAWLYALVGVLMITLPVIITHGNSSLLGALMFLFYWGVVAWYAHRAGARRLLSLAIFMLAARIWIIYLEQFGGLLSGGIGLITGGVLMLVMLALARRVNAKLTGKGSVADVG